MLSINEHPSKNYKIRSNAECITLRNLIIFMRMPYKIYWNVGLRLVAEKCILNKFGLQQF